MSTELRKITVVDGAQGEGGGQIFRTTLTLSICLGKPVCIENIRAGRKKPGLLRQHLTCLRAAQEICDAKIEGDELGSSSVTFFPGAIKSGDYRFAVGSAGSTTLVFQTVLWPLLLADDTSDILLEGGTHNGMAPSYEFMSTCFLPLIEKLGCQVEAELKSYGFYPAGGGAWKARIQPTKKIERLDLMDAEKCIGKSAVAMSARIPGHVTQRELSQIEKKCAWPKELLEQRLVQSVGPGNLVSLRLQMKNHTEVFESLGERNLRAEDVANRAVGDMERYLSASVPVGEYLADQLILPMVLGRGGQFRTLQPSQHLRTNIDVVRQLTGTHVGLTEIKPNCWEVSMEGLELSSG